MRRLTQRAIAACLVLARIATGDPILANSGSFLHPDKKAHYYEYYTHPNPSAVLQQVREQKSSAPYAQFYTHGQAAAFVDSLPPLNEFGGPRPHLATITSPSEQSFIARLTASPTVEGRPVAAWIGGHRETLNSPFQWNTGEPFSFTSFDSINATHILLSGNEARTWATHFENATLSGEYPGNVVEYDQYAPPIPWQSRLEGLLPVPSDGDGRKIVVVTHGWTGLSLDADASTTWVDELAANIATTVSRRNDTVIQTVTTPTGPVRRVDNVDIVTYRWFQTSDNSSGTPDSAKENAGKHGVRLGRVIARAGYSEVHLVGHSAGANLVQSAVEAIAEESSRDVTVQATFLDGYTGPFNQEASRYGQSATFAENYFHQGDSLFYWTTQGRYDHAHNLDVTGLAPAALNLATGHGWPRVWYDETVGAAESPDHGYGFRLSLSAEGPDAWKQVASTRGGPTRRLGSPTPPAGPAPLITTYGPLDLGSAITRSSVTGTIVADGVRLTMTTGSPVWLVLAIQATGPINFVTFDAEFVGGGEGVFSASWNGTVIFTLDERYTRAGLNNYVFQLPDWFEAGNYELAFRLDPYDSSASSIFVTNLRTGSVSSSAPVPEPSTFVLFGASLVTIVVVRRRRSPAA